MRGGAAARLGAALAHGAANFETGLRHAIRQAIVYDEYFEVVINEAAATGQPIHNLYRHETSASIDPEAPDEAVEAAIDREPSAYDSHPRPADRFRWARALEADATTSDDTGDPGEDAWALLGDRERLETQMTENIRQVILAGYGFDIADPEIPERDEIDEEE